MGNESTECEHCGTPLKWRIDYYIPLTNTCKECRIAKKQANKEVEIENNNAFIAKRTEKQNTVLNDRVAYFKDKRRDSDW